VEEAVTVTRWTRRLLFGAVALLVPALAGCEAGFNAPTLEYHPATNGVSTVERGISISNLFVLGPQLGSTLPAGGRASVFVALESKTGDRLVKVSAPGTASSAKLSGGSVTLDPGTLVDLSGPEPSIVLTGLTNPLDGGRTVQLQLQFANAGTVSLQVPVLPNAYEYSTFSPPAVPTPTASATPTPGGSAHPSPNASGSQAGQPKTSASPSR
jgi:copper(I)-binding protein